MPCFKSGSMVGLTNNQYILYSQAQSTFMRIYNYNLDIVTQRYDKVNKVYRPGYNSISYYVFKEGEQQLYKIGQRLMIQNDPVNAVNYYDFVQY